MDSIEPYPLYPRLYETFSIPLSAVDYRGQGGSIIRELKFNRNRKFLGLWIFLLTRAYERSLLVHPRATEQYNPIVIPVPPSHYGLWYRGWDPVLKAANFFARRNRFQVQDLLRRSSGGSQKLRSRKLRLEASGQFQIRENKVFPQNCTEVILVDDVVTTGATLEQISCLLSKEFAVPVRCITIAQD